MPHAKQQKGKRLSLSCLTHLKSLCSSTARLVSVQSLPPNPVLQAHLAVHLISVIAHDLSTLPDGSEYTHAPLPEHTEP